MAKDKKSELEDQLDQLLRQFSQVETRYQLNREEFNRKERAIRSAIAQGRNVDDIIKMVADYGRAFERAVRAAREQEQIGKKARDTDAKLNPKGKRRRK